MPVEAIGAVGPEWNIGLDDGFTGDAGAVGAPEDVGAAGAAGGDAFGGLVGRQIQNLQDLQETAAGQSQALAAGTAQDASEVVMAVERAQLSMQLAAQLRNKGVEAFQEIFRTQV